jgi:hypothetical protein
MPATQGPAFIERKTTPFFLVTGFGSGAYSEKLEAGTRQRFSGFNQPRQCSGDDVLRMLMTGGRRTSAAACPSAF